MSSTWCVQVNHGLNHLLHILPDFLSPEEQAAVTAKILSLQQELAWMQILENTHEAGHRTMR